MEERLEDGELGLQGGEVRASKRGAVGGIGGGEGGAILEGGEAYTSAGGHYQCKCFDLEFERIDASTLELIMP